MILNLAFISDCLGVVFQYFSYFFVALLYHHDYRVSHHLSEEVWQLRVLISTSRKLSEKWE